MIHGFKNSTLPASPTKQFLQYGHRPQLSRYRYQNLAKHLIIKRVFSPYSAERFLQAFRAVILLLKCQEPVFDPQLPDKQAGFRHSQCITDQVFKLTCDVEHRFEEINKSGIVLADLTASHNSHLNHIGTKT